MATYHLPFTKPKLTALKPPQKPKSGGTIFDTHYDEKEPGLVLLVTSGGSKTFYLYKKINGRPERIKLGRFPDVSVEAARKKAAQQKGQIADGKNPNDERKKLRGDLTLGSMFQQYMERYSKKHKRSWLYDQREVNKHLSHWFVRKASSITRQQIQTLHERLGEESGIYAANRLLERIRAIYNKSIEWGWEGINPAAKIKKFKEKSRDRFLQPDELPRFFAALDAEPNDTAREYIRLSLLTGARKANVLAMRWDQISFERAEWRIPETKNGDPLTVALSAPVMEILKPRQAKTQSEWVFPSEGSKTGHLADPKKAWRRVLDRAELFQLVGMIGWRKGWTAKKIQQEKSTADTNLSKSLLQYRQQAQELKLDPKQAVLSDLRIHDLRRSLGSWQASTGATGYVIGKSLGHKSQQATAIYARLNLDPVRESVERATEAILAAALTVAAPRAKRT